MPKPQPQRSLPVQAWGGLCFLLALLLNACTSPKPPPSLPAPAPVALPEPAPVAPEPPSHPKAQARDLKAYRLEMARHIYERHGQHVHAGRLPPLIKGVGVIEVTINDQGQVTHMEWVRAPRHVPEVVKSIEDLIEAAQPYPAPAFAKQATFMETWLWNRNNRFQLDSLTAGQD